MLCQEHARSTILSTTTPAVDGLDGTDVDDQGSTFPNLFLCVHTLAAELISIIIIS